MVVVVHYIEEVLETDLVGGHWKITNCATLYLSGMILGDGDVVPRADPRGEGGGSGGQDPP